MENRWVHRRWLVSVVVVGVVESSLTLGPSIARADAEYVTEVPAPDADALLARAEQQHAAEEYPQAARSYSAAYEALPPEDQEDLLGEIALDNALKDYRAAYEQTPEDIALLEEPIALLEGVERARGDAMPPPLADELERLRMQQDRDAGAVAALEFEAEASTEEGGSDEAAVPPQGDANEKSVANRTRDVVLLTSGLAGVVGGVALIAGGAWNFNTTDLRGDAGLSTLELEEEYTDAQREEYRAELAQWQQQWRGTATGLVVAGSMLTAVGVGIAAWGVVRMRRHGRSGARAGLVMPMVSRDRLGLGVQVTFR